MRAHLVNGLFPVLHIAHTLQRWGAPQFRYYDDNVRRVFMAGYVLHDWLKLPAVDAQLAAAGLRHDTVNAAQHLETVEEIFRAWCAQLGLYPFLEPSGGDLLLHDLIFVACNTQIKWGTLRNVAALPRLQLPGPQIDLAEQLSRLADYLAYIARNPRSVVADQTIHREISILSNQMARLVYHHVAEVRGVITNLIHNAALEARQSDDCVPLLYAPGGVVYLIRRQEVVTPDLSSVAEEVVRRVKRVAGGRLFNTLTGFNRDGKGLKYASYYALFFEKLEMLDVAVQATGKIIHAGKKPSAGKRFAKMAENAWLGPDVDLDLPDDFRVDQLAEWCYMAEKIARDLPGCEDASRFLLDEMDLGDLYEDFLAVPRDARSGGVGYHWYLVAGYYLKRNPGLDSAAWVERIAVIALRLKAYLTEHQRVIASETADDGFNDLRQYVHQVLTFGPVSASKALEPSVDVTAIFGIELDRYANAKKRGRGTTAMCALCSSPYTVNKQEEAAILFAPQVYSNKMVLHGSSAIRDICSICSLEMMLRQLLMNRSSTSGSRFEGRRLRYLYFYPTYFFTPETLEIFRILYSRLKHVSFTELRRQLVTDENGLPVAHLDQATWQRLEPLLVTPEDEFRQDKDRLLRMHFSDNVPVTFYFLGVAPPGRDGKDAESWVHPTFLALLLPLCVDVKVVASESQMPIFSEADELPETVFLDGAHAAIGYIVGADRINLDHLLPTLNRLTVSYLIHVDSNSDPGGKDFYRWQNLPTLARHLSESPMYAFWYLKKWQRSVKVDSVPLGKARLYLSYYQLLVNEGDDSMSHARTLTELYRNFYRAKGRPNSNSILRPISIAANALMDADRRIFHDEDSLVELVDGELGRFVNRVAENKADGRLPAGVDKPTRDQAIRAFASYFVRDLFFGTLKGDVSALRGKQLNLLKSACEVIYRDLDAQYWTERGKNAAEAELEEQSE
jgi:CRISPR-associated protein Csc3